MDLRVIDMSKFDVILEMDWLMANRIIVDYCCRRVTAYTHDGIHVMFRGISMMFYLKPFTTLSGTSN